MSKKREQRATAKRLADREKHREKKLRRVSRKFARAAIERIDRESNERIQREMAGA